MANPRVESATVLQCLNCGSRFTRGGSELACPACGSNKLTGVTIWGGSLEYALADRSEGYALEDIRFGKLAQWSGLISVNQYTDILNAQRAALTQSGRAPSLADIALRKGIMNKREVESVLRARVDASEDPSDEQFGRDAMENALLTQAQFLKAREIQLEMAAKGREVPPMALVLYEKRFVGENEIIALLRRQHQRDSGVLKLINDLLNVGKRPLTVRLFGEKDSRTRQVRLIGSAAVIFFCLVFAWSFGLVGQAEYVETVCVKCNAQSSAPLQSPWKPLICSSCHAAAVYPKAICEKCGEFFAVAREDPWATGIKCPKCGSAFYKLVTKDADVAAIRKKIADKAKLAEQEKAKERTRGLEGEPP